MASEVRQRKPPAASAKSVPAKGNKTAGDSSFSLLDGLRVIVLLLSSSVLLSWFVTGGEYWWGYRPGAYATVDYWKNLYVSRLHY